MRTFQKFAFSMLLLAAVGCHHLPIEAPKNAPAEQLNFLALGDSYTIGQSVAEGQRWPNQLGDSLRAAGFVIEKVQIIAKTGWRTAQLADAVAAAADAKQLDSSYALVALLIGVNDQYQNGTPEDYRPKFEAMLTRAVELAGGRTDRVFVVSIPDYAFTPFGQGSASISAEIDAFNAVNKQISDARGIRYFEITTISRLGLAQPQLVASDGLHPSGEQYRRWVASFWKEVAAMVE